MKKSWKRTLSLLLGLTLMIGLLAGLMPMRAAAADPFAEMYDSEALVVGELSRAAAGNTAPDNATPSNSASRERGLSQPVSFASEREESRRREEELRDQYRQDRYIIKYKATDSRSVSDMLTDFEAESLPLVSEGRRERTERGGERAEGRAAADRRGSTNRFELLVLDEKVNPAELADALRAVGAGSEIEYIQPDFVLSPDSLTLELPGEETEPSETPPPHEEEPSEEPEPEPEELPFIDNAVPVIVAVIDTGIDSKNPLLADYMLPGWNFPAQNNVTYDPSDPLASSHGTHVAGIIAQTAAEAGVNVQILPLQVFENGGAYTSDIIAAIIYAAEQGASVINCSWGGTAENQALRDIIGETEALFVCAAGNNRRDLDVTPSYPAAYRLDNVISVGSVNADGGFSYFSNYSPSLVDITAPGRDVVSAIPGGGTGPLTGTSMAAARVTGVAAAAVAVEVMADTPEALRGVLFRTSDRLLNLLDKVAQGRRVNLYNTLTKTEGDVLSLDPADDFDVHGYDPSESEQFRLYSAAGDIVQIAAGEGHVLVLKSDGTVWAWGLNDGGQCGNGTFSPTAPLGQVIGLSDVVYIAAGSVSSYAIKSNGTLWSWGNGSHGRLGTGNSTHLNTPAQVTALAGKTVVQAAASTHLLALTSAGEIYACGQNNYGPVGNGTTNTPITKLTLVGFPAGTVITKVFAAGSQQCSFAVDTSGKLWAWGYGAYGNLGDGTGATQTAPVLVNGITNVVSLGSGTHHTAALTSSGALYVWGRSQVGQLGLGSTGGTIRLTPVLSTVTNIVSVAANQSYTAALYAGGTVKSWGNGYHGDGLAGWIASSPTPVSGMSDVTAIAAGSNFTVALLGDGTLWGWGDNTYGQLGQFSGPEALSPVMVYGEGPDNGGTLALDVTEDEEYCVSIQANNIDSFTGVTYTLTYDPAMLKLIDFAAQTTLQSTMVGLVPGTPLEILSHANGTLTFAVGKSIPNGKVYSGALTVLRFAALGSGSTILGISQ